MKNQQANIKQRGCPKVSFRTYEYASNWEPQTAAAAAYTDDMTRRDYVGDRNITQ